MLYKGRVVFQQYIPKEHKRFSIKIYKLCYSLGYTSMSLYLGKQRQHATSQITATHGTVLHFEDLRDWATKFSWTIISHRLFCLMICSSEKSMRVELFAMAGVKFYEILDQNI